MTSTTRSTNLDVNAQVLAGLDGFHKAYTAAIAAPNPSDPTLAQYMTGRELTKVHVFLTQLADAGRVIKITVSRRDPRMVSLQGSTAVVDECSTYVSSRAYDAKTGQDVGPFGDAAKPDGNEFTLQLEAGTWRVASSAGNVGACP